MNCNGGKYMKKKMLVSFIIFLALIVSIIGIATITLAPRLVYNRTVINRDSGNFRVEIVDEISVSNTDKVEAYVNKLDTTKAIMNVRGLSKAGDFATATFPIINKSTDLYAALFAETSNTNSEYFDVTYNIAKPTNLAVGEKTTITVTVTLKKDVLVKEQTGTTVVTVKANPVQPKK